MRFEGIITKFLVCVTDLNYTKITAENMAKKSCGLHFDIIKS